MSGLKERLERSKEARIHNIDYKNAGAGSLTGLMGH